MIKSIFYYNIRIEYPNYISTNLYGIVKQYELNEKVTSTLIHIYTGIFFIKNLSEVNKLRIIEFIISKIHNNYLAKVYYIYIYRN